MLAAPLEFKTKHAATIFPLSVAVWNENIFTPVLHVESYLIECVLFGDPWLVSNVVESTIQATITRNFVSGKSSQRRKWQLDRESSKIAIVV